MSEPTSAELQETIDELKAYRQRLQDDVVAMGQKLKLPQARIDATLAEHPELQRLDEVLTQLASQLDAAAN
jgi:predicted  nucleic acid-binding Zn-ribbon protein